MLVPLKVIVFVPGVTELETGEAIGMCLKQNWAKTLNRVRPGINDRRTETYGEIYCRSFSSAWGAALAWAMAAIEDCCNTCALLRLAASCATFASRMPDSAAESFVICELARLVAYCRMFSPAPTRDWTSPS